MTMIGKPSLIFLRNYILFIFPCDEITIRIGFPPCAGRLHMLFFKPVQSTVAMKEIGKSQQLIKI